MTLFSQDQLQALTGARLETPVQVSPGPIQHLLASTKMIDPGPVTKRIRAYNAFVESQNTKQNRTHVLEFIRIAMKPARHSRDPERMSRSEPSSIRPSSSQASLSPKLANGDPRQSREPYRTRNVVPKNCAPTLKAAVSIPTS